MSLDQTARLSCSVRFGRHTGIEEPVTAALDCATHSSRMSLEGSRGFA